MNTRLLNGIRVPCIFYFRNFKLIHYPDNPGLATATQNIYLRALNSQALKVAPLLAQYFYINKRLDLPALGTFLLDPSVIIEPETSKQGKPINLEGVSFESNASIKDSPELIQFISSHTGKIKALAAADLNSHLGLALQFLNIGKPFLFEGIGSLSKIRSGEYSFTAAQALPMKDYPVKETSTSSRAEEPDSDYKSIFYLRKTKTTWKKPLAVLLLLGGLALAIWGGYTVYKRTTAKKDNAADKEIKKDETVLVTDTAKYQKDTPVPVKPATVPAGTYKIILETSNAKRAFARFSRLQTFQWNVSMETSDSLSFKIFMLLPAAVADTSRIIDSLSRLNGKRVYIENIER